jgi:NADH dehydrogenase FAD-containing subunit
MSEARERVVVVGGSLGGLSAAQYLSSIANVILIDPKVY